ncbi:FkbO/Hyg5 family chorismatase [Glycomyces arizonensis]|uniref:FkbO/Hyg5 family chorismatase n=1 Tax=Glycomyces arizonensis TaxID=256035 RepID=UPI0003F8229F|nr:FkbO/Hyg5 family chorismatase [Glycomyces arizonensis]
MISSTLAPCIGDCQPEPLPRAADGFTLAEITYRSAPASLAIAEGPAGGGHLAMTIPMARHGESGYRESWRGTSPPETGDRDDVLYACTGEAILCATAIEHRTVYAPSVERRYRAVFDLLEERGYRRLLRVWNFIETINAVNADDLEVYRDFCKGRADAFSANPEFCRSMPAATGIGSTGSGIAFFLLAVKDIEVRHIENRRQTPAYEYPEQYGPRSPSFARASAITTRPGAERTLYISGTASILGHETVHDGDIEKQCATTAENIAELIDSCYGGAKDLKDATTVKAYVRHAHHVPYVRAFCEEVFGTEASLAVFNVDICRSDLLVEIEAVVGGKAVRP